MDQVVNAAQFEQAKPKEKNTKILVAILVLIAFVLLFLILFTFHFFNVFGITNVIPGFSRLPSRIVKPTPFPYDNQASETKLGTFLQKNINAAYLPPSSNGYFHAGFITETNWINTKDDKLIAFDAKLFLKNTSNDVRYITLTAFPNFSVKQEDLNTALTSYFNISISAPLPCFDDQTNKTRYCQQLTQDGNTKHIVGARFDMSNVSTSKQTNFLYYCELYQNTVNTTPISCINIP